MNASQIIYSLIVLCFTFINCASVQDLWNGIDANIIYCIAKYLEQPHCITAINKTTWEAFSKGRIAALRIKDFFNIHENINENGNDLNYISELLYYNKKFEHFVRAMTDALFQKNMCPGLANHIMKLVSAKIEAVTLKDRKKADFIVQFYNDAADFLISRKDYNLFVEIVSKDLEVFITKVFEMNYNIKKLIYSLIKNDSVLYNNFRAKNIGYTNKRNSLTDKYVADCIVFDFPTGIYQDELNFRGMESLKQACELVGDVPAPESLLIHEKIRNFILTRNDRVWRQYAFTLNDIRYSNKPIYQINLNAAGNCEYSMSQFMKAALRAKKYELFHKIVAYAKVNADDGELTFESAHVDFIKARIILSDYMQGNEIIATSVSRGIFSFLKGNCYMDNISESERPRSIVISFKSDSDFLEIGYPQFINLTLDFGQTFHALFFCDFWSGLRYENVGKFHQLMEKLYNIKVFGKYFSGFSAPTSYSNIALNPSYLFNYICFSDFRLGIQNKCFKHPSNIVPLGHEVAEAFIKYKSIRNHFEVHGFVPKFTETVFLRLLRNGVINSETVYDFEYHVGHTVQFVSRLKTFAEIREYERFSKQSVLKIISSHWNTIEYFSMRLALVYLLKGPQKQDLINSNTPKFLKKMLAAEFPLLYQDKK